MTALKRVAANTEKRLRNEKGNPGFGLQFYVLDAKGRHAGVTMQGAATYAVCDENGARHDPCEALFG